MKKVFALVCAVTAFIFAAAALGVFRTITEPTIINILLAMLLGIVYIIPVIVGVGIYNTLNEYFNIKNIKEMPVRIDTDYDLLP